MKKFTLILLVMLCGIMFSFNSLAVTAYPGLVTFVQPDGTKLNVFLKGDEKMHWASTPDGFTIMFNKNGFYEYAILDAKGDMNPSGIKANNPDERGMAESELLNRTQKGIFYSQSQLSLLRSIKQMKYNQSNGSKSFPTTGNRNLVCILMGFTDKAFTKTQSDFNNLYNQVGYAVDGATGSIKDYFLENSFNQLTLTVTVAGPYTAAYNMAYYGGNDTYGDDLRPRELVAEAVTLADPDVNYANFDNDGDGSVDGVYVIYAGYGEEANGGADCIWAHAWNLATTLTKDGKTISKYSCSSELRGNSGSDMTRIGVICHEFGHVLGAPDYYDTDYATGGQYEGTGDWDLQAGGSWNGLDGDGATPAHSNPYTKIYIYNWASATTISSGTSITLNNAEQNSTSFYRINTTTSNEYYLIENRQQHKFDSYIPGHGMIIYHVHSTIGTSNINTTAPQKMYPVCANATTNPSTTPTSYGTINGAGCPFPGSSSKTSFTDATTPWMKSWAGANTSAPITNIVENVGLKTITFDFMGGPTTDPTGFTATASSTTQIDLSWALYSGKNVMLAWSSNGVFGTPSGSYSVGNTISGGGTVLYSGSATSFNHTGLNASTMYYYKIFSILDGTPTYSSGVTSNSRTLCGAISALPFSETFDATTTPGCWDNIDNNGAPEQLWQFGTIAAITFGTGNYAYLNSDAYGSGTTQDADLITPTLNLSTYSNIALSFTHYFKFISGSSATLYYSINNGSSWTQVQQWTANTSNPESFNQTITALNGQSSVKFRWKYQGTYGWYWCIDNVQITGSAITNYPEPTNHITALTSGTITQNAIPLNWTDATGAQLPGGYLIHAVKQGVTPSVSIVDGTPITDDLNLADGEGVANVNFGVQTFNGWTGMLGSTTYDFYIYPFTNPGCANINYKTNGTIPHVQATTLAPTYLELGTGTADNNLPINPYYGYSYSQSIYLQSEINVANKQITKISYYYSGSAWTDNVVIYMGHTTKTAFSSITDWVPSAQLTQVYSGTLAVTTTAGWIDITLSTPFSYNNTNNLVIAIDENTSGYHLTGDKFNNSTTAANRSILFYDDAINPDPTLPPTSGTHLSLVLGYANVKLYVSDIPPTTQATNLLFSNVGQTGMDISWTRGNGTKCAVFMLSGNSGSPSPSNNTTYSASTTFGSGTQIGTTGWYCIANGTASGVTVSGLTQGTTYRIMVCEYNGAAGSEKYLTTGGTGNPANKNTFAATLTITTSGNWDNNLINASTDVTVQPGVTFVIPATKQTSECNSLTLKPLSNLTIEGSLTVTNDVVVESDATGSGSLIDLGSLIYGGVGRQQMYIPQSNRYYYVSIPVSMIDAGSFNNIAGADKLYYRNTATSSWVQITNPGDFLEVTRGYATKQSAAPITINLDGTLNTGIKNIPLVNTGDGWNLIGNPYPSPVDWGTENNPVTGWTKTGIRNTIYIKNGGTFAIWNAALDGTALNGGTRYIPAMQAFWVKSLSGGSSINMTNSIRVHNGNTLMKGQETLCQKLRIKVSRQDFTDEALIMFHPDADASFDKLDAEKLFATENDYPQIYTMGSNQKMAINSFPLWSEIFVLHLGFKTQKEGTFVFDFSEMESFNAGSVIYLEDRIAHKIVNLMLDPTYTFSSDITDNLNRFVLHFSDGTTQYYPEDGSGFSDIDENLGFGFKIYAADHAVYVKSNQSVQANIKVFNILGLEMRNVDMKGNFEKIELSIPGTYMVKVINSECNISRKVNIK